MASALSKRRDALECVKPSFYACARATLVDALRCALPMARLPDLIHSDWTAAGAGMGARLCRAVLHAFGWRIVIDAQRLPKALIVFYPHTSNWDFVIGLLARFGAGIPVTWAGKDSIFRGPFAGLWRRLGGIAVNRR